MKKIWKIIMKLLKIMNKRKEKYKKITKEKILILYKRSDNNI